jgi:hypothetical protein
MELVSSMQNLIDDEIDIKEGLNITLISQDNRKLGDSKGNYSDIYAKLLEEEKQKVRLI